ncbi:LmbE family N-acetylglucosaminyl deacetylase [Streptosporangium becharense]|uniref:LmbE family N-acetylglucosaminyl deacetylase n=1 Tax=Streptosporangium becharense TaxID=1816182 RepID=A0A7W9IFQ1_9ACTN|nr:PIG-L deacetylase family protein [Streptosporangium becharense]MBB2909558.1 LmbE family N-acetylglucosaminyl deacetylase [Streptosporangium becharense]MBB5819486.1 LmbE family N-acetylglucosaminyl deacetylase [Streptosporangium becharense]
MLSDNDIHRVLVVTAHPDDVDFGAAGSVARFTDRGAEVTYCVVTDGDAGGFDRELDNGGMAGLRRAEQTAAAKIVGVTDVRFLGYGDGTMVPGLDLRRDITRVIRQVRPDLVITHSPERNYRFISPSHPDHRAVGASALDAVYPDARNPYAFPPLLLDEGLEAWTVREVWLFGGPTPDHHVDVTDTFDRKLAALRAHVSQTGHQDGFEDFLRIRFSAFAVEAGLGEGRYAEAFQRVPTA